MVFKKGQVWISQPGIAVLDETVQLIKKVRVRGTFVEKDAWEIKVLNSPSPHLLQSKGTIDQSHLKEAYKLDVFKTFNNLAKLNK